MYPAALEVSSCHRLQPGSLSLSFINLLRGEFASLDPLCLIFLPREIQLSASIVILKSKQQLECKELLPSSRRVFFSHGIGAYGKVRSQSANVT